MKPEQVFACNSQLPSDAPRRMSSKPELGDRVVNLSAQVCPHSRFPSVYDRYLSVFDNRSGTKCNDVRLLS